MPFNDEQKPVLVKKISRWRHKPYRNSQQVQIPLTTDIIFLHYVMLFISIILVILTLPFSVFFCMKVAKEYERVVIFRLGKLRKFGVYGPGIYLALPCVDSCRKVDLRVITYDIPPQEILSKDSVTVNVDAVVYVRTADPVASVVNVSDAFYSTKLLTQTTLRNVLGTKTLSEMLSDRDGIAAETESALDEGTEPWGVKVERVEVKDIRLPQQLTRAMAAEAEAAREARAKVIAAEGEQKASRALRDAANVLSGCATAVQLRYLQTLNNIAAEHNSTIVFPLPLSVLCNGAQGASASNGGSPKATPHALSMQKQQQQQQQQQHQQQQQQQRQQTLPALASPQ